MFIIGDIAEIYETTEGLSLWRKVLGYKIFYAKIYTRDDIVTIGYMPSYANIDIGSRDIISPFPFRGSSSYQYNNPYKTIRYILDQKTVDKLNLALVENVFIEDNHWIFTIFPYLWKDYYGSFRDQLESLNC